MTVSLDYIIEYRPCPTSYSAPVFIRTNTLSEWLVFGSADKVVLSLAAKMKGHSYASGSVVMRVHQVLDGHEHVHYKENGYGKNHVSEELRNLVPIRPKEVLA